MKFAKVEKSSCVVDIFKMTIEILPNCTFSFVIGTTALVTKILAGEGSDGGFF